MATTFLTFLLVFVLFTSNSAKLRGLDVKVAGLREAGDEPTKDHYDLDKVVMRRGIEELAIAKNANNQAAFSAKDAKTGQENLIAMQAIGRTEDSYLKVKPLVAEARAQMLTVRKFEAEAKLHAKHAREVLFGSRFIPEAAAEKAIEATSGWIKHEATASAQASSTVDNRQDKLVAAVASAAEPYHLALLRNQKFCEETYAKAKSAQGSASKLLSDAKKVALKAQELQAVGQGVEARQTWGMAAGMSNEAELLRQWGQKLYGQASTACGTSGGYELLEQQAAANAAASLIMNAPPKLPPK
jgi:hypothetical protein